MLVPTEKQIIEKPFSLEGHCSMRKFAVEGDNCDLDVLNVASQHGSLCAEPRDGICHSVEVIGILAVVKEKVSLP